MVRYRVVHVQVQEQPCNIMQFFVFVFLLLIFDPTWMNVKLIDVSCVEALLKNKKKGKAHQKPLYIVIEKKLCHQLHHHKQRRNMIP